MKKISNEKLEIIIRIRAIVVSIFAIMILSWAYGRNNNVGKIIILPFLICSVAALGEHTFSLLHQQKLSFVCQIIFRISIILYAYGLLFYVLYYSIAHRSYSLIIGVVIFLFFITRSLGKRKKSR